MSDVVSITDAAESTITLETHVETPATFAAVSSDRDRNPFLAWRSSPGATRIHQLRDVELDRSTMVLLKDGRIIQESCYLRSPADLAALRQPARKTVSLDDGRTYATVCDHWERNHYHWMAHAVPALGTILAGHEPPAQSRFPWFRPRGDFALLTPRLTRLHRATLSLMGADGFDRVTIRPGERYRLGRLEYHDRVAGLADFAISATARAAYERLAAAVPETSGPERIYIDRSGAANRPIPNEAALIARLRQAGFHPVRTERLRLDQQIALFRGARVIVAAHGAGLSNIVFSRPGTIVYELVPSHYRNPCFLALARQTGLAYWADLFDSGGQDGDHRGPWANDIAIERVMTRIGELTG